MESENTPMHIAGTATYDAAPLTKADGGIDIDRIRAYVESRLHLIPRYRQRLQQSWFRSAPDLGRRPALQHPLPRAPHARCRSPVTSASSSAWRRASCRSTSTARSRCGRSGSSKASTAATRVAMISKIHHCMVDGMSSVDLLNVLLTPYPIDHVEPAPVRTCRARRRRSWELLWETAGTVARLPVRDRQDRLRAGQPGRRSALRRPRQRARGRATCSPAASAASASPTRRSTRADRPAPPLRLARDEPGRHQGASRTVSAARSTTSCSRPSPARVRRFLERRRVNCDDLDFRVMAPVSVRTADEHGDARQSRVGVDRRPAARRARPAATAGGDPRDHRAAQGSQAGARRRDADAGRGVDAVDPALARLAHGHARPAVQPGRHQRARAAGAALPARRAHARQLRLRAAHRLDLCLGIVLFSYAGQLCWGFTCEWDLLPDLHDFVVDVEGSFKELQRAGDAVEARDAPAPKPAKPAKAKRRRAHKSPTAGSVHAAG